MRRIRPLLLALTLALVATLPSPAGAQSKGDVKSAKSEQDQAYEELVRANDELGAAMADLEGIDDELRDLGRRIDRLHGRIEEYRSTVEDLQRRARELVVETYIRGGGALITAAFSAGTIQDLLTSQALIDQATNHDLIALDRLAAVSREMDRLTVQLDAEEAEATRLEAQQAQKVAELQELQRHAEEVFSTARRKYREVYAKYREAQRRAALAAAARRRGAGRGLPASTTRGVVCPVRGSTWFVDTWGAPRPGGRQHHGTDLSARSGTPLVAMYGGRVRIGTSYLGGKQVYVYGDNGVFFYYAHLSRWARGLKTGDRVKKGQIIGYAGATGDASGPHLHLGMGLIGGGFVNPYPTVRAVC